LSNCENLVPARIASSKLIVVTASHLAGSQVAKPVSPQFSIEAASGFLNRDRRKNSSFSTVSANTGHSQTGRRGQFDLGKRSLWSAINQRGRHEE
jgi:hypothetical protein